MDFRISPNDPNYEHIRGQRRSRRSNYWANLFIIFGLLLLFAGGVGLLPLLLGIALKIRAHYLRTVYRA